MMLVKRIPDIIELAEPALDRQLDELSTRMNVELPVEYRQLMKESNGVHANLVELYPIEDIPERNETYEVAQYAPGYLLIGSVCSFPLLLKSGRESPVYQNDWGAMSPDCMTMLGTSLADWIAKGCPDSEY